MAGFSAIDLSLLPAPDVLESVSFETNLSEMVAHFRGLDPAFDALVESDPVMKVLEVAAYYKTLTEQRVNDAARAVMPAFAQGGDLDNIAAIYGVERLTITAGDEDAVPPVAPVLEDDAALRRRMFLAFEGLSVAGPEGAYIFHALGADPDVADASVASPEPGQVVVTVLSRAAGGSVAPETLQSVRDQLENVRPLTDQLTIQAASVVNYDVVAELTVFAGPDSEVVRQAAQAAARSFTEAQRGLGLSVTLSALYAALHVHGVQKVTLSQPVSDLNIASDEAPLCGSVSVTVGGVHG